MELGVVECGVEVALSGGFTGKERKVEMEGEVYFEVAKNKEKPFIVNREWG